MRIGNALCSQKDFNLGEADVIPAVQSTKGVHVDMAGGYNVVLL